MQFEDGIGDACDPRASFTGDLLGAFHAFADGTDERPWRGAGWAIANDAAQATGDASWRHAAVLPGDGLYAELRIASVAWTAADARISVGVDGDDAQLGHTCSLVRDRDADGSDELEISVFATKQTLQLGAAVTGNVVLTAWRLIDRDRVGRVFCRIEIEDDMNELVLPSDDSAPGRYGFASIGATTAVDSLVVYTFPVNPCSFSARCEPDQDP